MTLKEFDITSSIKEHLQNKGYSVSVSENNTLSAEIIAKKGKETFVIEGIWETKRPSTEAITYALGKIVKRMEKRGPWFDYGVAIPKIYFKELKNFESTGFETLNLHLFLVESFTVLTHLNPKGTLELIHHLKEGDVSSLHIWGINYE